MRRPAPKAPPANRSAAIRLVLLVTCVALASLPQALHAQELPPTTGAAVPNPYGSVAVDPDRHLDFANGYRPEWMELEGYVRIRGEAFGNMDLGTLGTEGELAGAEDWTESANMRLRLAPILHLGKEAAIHLEVDFLDNLVLGSTPDGLPRTSSAPAVGASSTQEAPSAGLNGWTDSVRVKKAWLEVMTPLGLLLAGRMGNNWGLGMLASAGDDLDDDYDDSVDRVAFVTSLFDHAIVVGYDFNANGPTTARRSDRRGQAFDLTDQDDVRTLNLGIARMDTVEMTNRRLASDLAVVNYGVAFSYRWQDMDLPSYYAGAPGDQVWQESELVDKDFTAYLVDAWIKVSFRAGGWTLRVEAEGAYLHGSVDSPDPLPNVEANFDITSDQGGLVARLRVQPPSVPLWLELQGGWASGDPAPGFGVWAANAENGTVALPQPGDLDGLQIQLPAAAGATLDTAVDNFRFHPNFRVDEILWRRIIGTVTDAWYLRFDAKWYPLEALKLQAGIIYSETLHALSAPGLARPLGVELDLGATYYTRGGFEARLVYAVLLPLDGLRDYFGGVDPEPAHVVRGLLAYRF